MTYEEFVAMLYEDERKEAAFRGVPEIVPPELTDGDDDGLRREEAAQLLDDYLRRLASQEARCRRVVGKLAARFLREKGYHRLGFARLSDYSRERLGLSAREVQDLALVARRLAELPSLRQAFDEGRLSWSHVRLIAGIATYDDEDEWVERAEGRSVRGLAEEVRQTRRAEEWVLGAGRDDEEYADGEERKSIRVGCPAWVELDWRKAGRLAAQMQGSEGPVWKLAEAIGAEALSAAPGSDTDVCAAVDATGPRPDDAGSSDPNVCASTGDGAGLVRDGSHASGADVCGPDASRNRRLRILSRYWYPPSQQEEERVPFGWDSPDETIPETFEDLAGNKAYDVFTLDRRMRMLLRSMQSIDWQTGRCLRRVAEGRLHELFGFRTAKTYARERLGMSPSKAETLIRLDRKCDDCPELTVAYRAGDLSWVQATTLLPVVRGEATGAWIERARKVTVRRLADEVGRAVDTAITSSEHGDIWPAPIDATPAETGSTQTCALPDPEESRPVTSEVGFSGPASVVELFREAIHAWRTPGEPAWKGLGRLLRHVIAEWEAQPSHENRVFEREGYRCAVPGCTSRTNLQVHHRRFRSKGGGDEESNLVVLCLWHHQRGIHNQYWGMPQPYIRVNGDGAPPELLWELGLKPSGPLMRLRGDVHLEQESDASASAVPVPAVVAALDAA